MFHAEVTWHLEVYRLEAVIQEQNVCAGLEVWGWSLGRGSYEGAGEWAEPDPVGLSLRKWGDSLECVPG